MICHDESTITGPAAEEDAYLLMSTRQGTMIPNLMSHISSQSSLHVQPFPSSPPNAFPLITALTTTLSNTLLLLLFLLVFILKSQTPKPLFQLPDLTPTLHKRLDPHHSRIGTSNSGH